MARKNSPKATNAIAAFTELQAPDVEVPTAELDDETESDDLFAETFIGSIAQRFLGRVVRFLVGIQSPPFARVAQREGYTKEEHATGWDLWRKAVGGDRPLEHWFAEQSAAGTFGGDSLALLQPIDDFENKWFPRTRAIIRRVVDAASRDTFASAFFQNLEQQPLGPAVVGSVATFLDRVDALEKSPEAHAQEVRKTLAARGLTAKRITAMRTLLAEVQEGSRSGPRTAVPVKELEAAQKAQEQAMSSLRDGFNDWGTTLRPVFNAREQVKLGLVTMKRSAAEEAVVPAPPEGAGASA